MNEETKGMSVSIDTSPAMNTISDLQHSLHGGCFAVKCVMGHFVSSCECDGTVKRLRFIEHGEECLTGTQN
jgi:hypothetical protein